MSRWLPIACVVLFVLPDSAVAGKLRIVDLPATYTPGGSFSFNVELGGVSGLNSYDINLLMSAESGVAGADFFFSGAVRAPDSSYVFGSGASAGFFLAIPSTDGANATLNLSDFLDDPFASVTTVDGVNDLVATITVGTTGNVGNLMIGFDPVFPANLFDPDFNPVQGFDPASDVDPPQTVAPADATVVPEPDSPFISSICIFCALVFGLRRRKPAPVRP
jgi:hypothetical protein